MIERRNGSIKSKRLNKNLLDSPFQIDQRSFWDIMGYMSSFLEHINYYDIDNQIDGKWDAIVKADPIIFMVTIINEPTKDLKDLAQSYAEVNSIAKVNLKTTETLLNWYRAIDKWHIILLNLGEVKLADKIKNILVDVLDYQRSSLFNYHNRLAQTVEKKKGALKSPPLNPIKIDANKDPDIAKIIHTFQKVIIHIQEFTKDYLEQNIFSKNSHMPNNAIYIAFTLLFKTVQDNLNALSKRHLDFYYRDILQQKNSKGLPTKTIVSFDLLSSIDYSLIEKGTELSAGKLFGSETDILFQTEKPIVAYQMELVEMQTLLFSKSPYIKIGTKDQLISSVSKNNLITAGKESTSRNNWFVFGANKKTLRNTQIDEKKVADLGFIIGSPVFILSEGKRIIDLKINMEATSAKSVFWELFHQIQTEKGTTMDTIFSELFYNGLKISYTTKKGWVKFKKYSGEYDEANNYLILQLVLENSDPALENSTKIDEKLTWPSIKVELNEYSPSYLYSFFKGLEIDTIDLNVKVDRMRDLSLYNNLGQMPLDSSFDLFGPLPEVGSYLMIGKSELFQKQINTLEVNLEWDNLPNDFGGFETYYDGYSGAIKNDSFKVQLTALSNSYWLPTNLNSAPVFNLYSTYSCLTPQGYESVQLDKSSLIQLEGFKELGTSMSFDLKEPLKYSVTTQSGYFKLTFIAPKQGYGNDVYQKEFIEIATYNAKNKNQIALLNKPYIPKVKHVSVNYKASDKLVFNSALSKSKAAGENKGEFIHITPFGMEDVITNQNVKKLTLFPDFQQEGYLIMGFKGVKGNTTASIYFHLLQSSTGVSIKKEGLTWEYFQLNNWVEFDKGDIILDQTEGFVKSGIIELIMPRVEELKDGGKLSWIRISTRENTQDYPKVKGIYLNAVETICSSDDELVIGKNIPAKSIKKLVTKLPDVKKVVQPRESSGGVLEGTDNQFYTKVSERLRHKSRAAAIWDYERLILDTFEEVKVVKCTNFDESFNPSPGKVKVIVLSSHWTNSERHYFNENSLTQMESFLRKHSSPFVDIQVLNPTIEYLLVNCNVEFMPEDNGGYYLNLLNKDISNFLSPISNINNGIGGIGGNIVPTMLLTFLENLPYIKRTEKLTIEHIVRDGLNEYKLGVHKDGEEIKANTPWSILAPVKQHHIESILNKNQSNDILKVGIGNMQIGLDLILGDRDDCEHHSHHEDNDEVMEEENELQNDAIFVFKNKA